MFLPLHPHDRSDRAHLTATAATRPTPPAPNSLARPSQLEIQLLSAYLGVPASRLAAELAHGRSLAAVILQNGGTLSGFRRFLSVFGTGFTPGLTRGPPGHRRRR